MDKISVVIPCYGSASTIEQVVEEIKKTVAENGKYDYEIILINDCSPDEVYSKIVKLAEADKKIKGISLAKNFGQHSAILTGMRYATGSIVVCMDDDGQTPASQMFRLVDKLNEGYDAVFARYQNKKHALFRNFGSRMNDFMACTLINKPKDLAIMSYFCCRKFVVEEITKYENPYPYLAGLVLRTTKNVANVDIDHKERISGTSGYSIKKLISLWLNGFTAFSIQPLRIATALGVIFAFVGFLYGIYVIINKLLNPAAPLGYSSTMAVLVFVGGVVMLMLGLIGEYIGRIYISLNNSPQSVVRQSINLEDNKN